MKNLFRKILWSIGKNTRLHAINKNLSQLNLEKIKQSKRYNNQKNLINFGFKSYSQSDEDGIIEEIFNRIGVSNKNFIEIGVQDGLECNTTYLLNQGWNGMWIEQDIKQCNKILKTFDFLINKKLKLINKTANFSNINNIIKEHWDLKQEVDLLSIDIGLNTFHVLNEIDIIKPRVIVTEYNSKYGPKTIWKVKRSENENWDGSDYFGASLKSFELMMEKKDYLLIGCNITGVNAFFLRKDLVNEKFLDNFTSEFHYENQKIWLIKAFEPDLKIKIKEFET